MLDISVVIPFFNSEKTILRSIESINHQSLLPKEIIVLIDGCNSNEYFDLLDKIVINIPIFTIVLNENRGPSYCRNLGVKFSTSKYIAFLDADDVWHPQKLGIQHEFMIENNLKFSFHKYSEMPFEKKIIYTCCKNKILNKYNFLFKQYIATPTVMVEKKSFVFFDENLRYCEDYLCWMMNIDLYKKIYMIDIYLAHGFKKALGVSGLSSNIKKMHLGYISANIRLFNAGKISLIYCFFSILIEFVKYPLRYFK